MRARRRPGLPGYEEQPSAAPTERRSRGSCDNAGTRGAPGALAHGPADAQRADATPMRCTGRFPGLAEVSPPQRWALVVDGQYGCRIADSPAPPKGVLIDPITGKWHCPGRRWLRDGFCAPACDVGERHTPRLPIIRVAHSLAAPRPQDRHGEQLIARQKVMVAWRERNGMPTAPAVELVELLSRIVENFKRSESG